MLITRQWRCCTSSCCSPLGVDGADALVWVSVRITADRSVACRGAPRPTRPCTTTRRLPTGVRVATDGQIVSESGQGRLRKAGAGIPAMAIALERVAERTYLVRVPVP